MLDEDGDKQCFRAKPTKQSLATFGIVSTITVNGKKINMWPESKPKHVQPNAIDS